jgi:myo-inositol-1(or 4)-monophosphatase
VSSRPEDLLAVKDALHRASEVLRRHAKTDVPFELKDGWSPVTAADREIDALLREMLPGPGDGWLSEESDDDERRLSCRRIWIVDPLDGTRSFVSHRPEYAVSIALVVDGVPVLGAVGNPASGVSVVGGPGIGLEVRGDPALAWPEPAAPLRVLASRSEWKRGEWKRLQAVIAVLPQGSVAYKLALVAAGFADATWTLNPKHEWDVAAGAALVAAAGGEVWLPRGGPVEWNKSRPLFRGFAAARPGLRPRIETLLSSEQA